MPASRQPDKKRVIVDYKNVTAEILDLFNAQYPEGYDQDHIIRFKNAKGELVRAVPFETEDTKFLIKVSVEMDAKIEAYREDDIEPNPDTEEEAESPDLEIED